MTTGHLAEMKFTLAHEHWSPTSPDEEKILSSIVDEDERRRAAVKKTRDAQLALREAELKKAEEERRWAKRQEEKARYTEQQRAYWDAELAGLKRDHKIDISSMDMQKQHDMSGEGLAHSQKIDEQEKAMALREVRVRRSNSETSTC
jgi:hypothetical protein